jgi:N-acetyl-anhydromuramyl-L-alanine amidase AmpD
MMQRIKFLLLFSLALTFASCSTVPVAPTNVPDAAPRSTVRHTVGPGETLWRISKIYDVPPAVILKTNHLTSETLHMGAVLRIPHAKIAKQDIPLYPSKKWRYIIIHHSATEAGDALAFHKAHQAKGWDSIGYHFVIDNGEGGRPDGFVEITPRWLKQLDGAHCKASDMNPKAIGICLVGNFDEDHPTHTQEKALHTIVNKLRKFYHIPIKNILRHGEVKEAQTDCPGKKFPWKEFKREL